MPRYPVLFVGNRCKESRKLMQKWGQQLSRCPTILIYDRRDVNTRRRRHTVAAMQTFKVTRFPTLVFADGSRLDTRLSIEQDLVESTNLVTAEQPLVPRIQDAAPQPSDPRSLGAGPAQPLAAPALKITDEINLHDPRLKTSMMGSWPTQDSHPNRAAENMDPRGGSTMQHGGGGPAPVMLAGPSLDFVQDGAHGQAIGGAISPLSYTNNMDMRDASGREAIGASSDIDPSAPATGTGTSLRPNYAPTYDEEQEQIGQWPSRGRVNGLTGRGNKPMDTHTYLADRATRNNQLQGTQMQMGQVVSDPVPCYT